MIEEQTGVGVVDFFFQLTRLVRDVNLTILESGRLKECGKFADSYRICALDSMPNGNSEGAGAAAVTCGQVLRCK